MKRATLTIFSLLSLIALASASAFAATNVPAVATPTATTKVTTATAAQTARLAKLQADGGAQIQSRLTNLNKLTGVIAAAKHMTTTDKTSLSNEVATEISGLTTLQTQLNGQTTVTAALADVQSIFTEFRVYALIDPKVRLIEVADNQQTIEATLTTLSTKLQSRIDGAKKAGKDTTAMQASLDDMKAQIANAQAISSPTEASVIGLLPTDYNSDHTILKQYETSLKTAHADCHAAHKDAQTIINDLKSLK